MTKRQEEYAEYLTTEHWKSLRQAALDRDDNKCVRCSYPLHLQVHHKVYRDKFEDSELFELETLCRTCHKKEHGIEPTKPIQQPRRKHKHRKQSFQGIRGITDIRSLRRARAGRHISRKLFKRLMKELNQRPQPRFNPVRPQQQRAIALGAIFGEGKRTIFV